MGKIGPFLLAPDAGDGSSAQRKANDVPQQNKAAAQGDSKDALGQNSPFATYGFQTVSEDPCVIRTDMSDTLCMTVWFDYQHYYLSGPSILERRIAQESGGYFIVSTELAERGFVFIRLNPCMWGPEKSQHGILSVVDEIVKNLRKVEKGRRDR